MTDFVEEKLKEELVYEAPRLIEIEIASDIVCGDSGDSGGYDAGQDGEDDSEQKE